MQANREYARLRKRIKSLPGGKDHPAAKPSTRTARGGEESVEAQLLLELATIGSAREMKGLAAAALAMARVMDDPTATPQHPGAAGQLRMLLKDIRAGARKSGGRQRRRQLHAVGDNE